MFYSFFDSLARSRYLSFFSLSFHFTLCLPGTAKFTILQILLLLLLLLRPDRLAEIKWCVSISALADSLLLESSPVFRTLFNILANLNNAVVWMVSARLPISYSSRAVPSAPITIGITVTLMFHSFFGSLTRAKYFSLFVFSGFHFHRMAKSTTR